MRFTTIFGEAKYIAATQNMFPYFRKQFKIHKTIKKATLFVSCLGFAELYINNRLVTNDLYITTLSHYNKRTPDDIGPYNKPDRYFKDTLGYTIYVSKFDIKDFLLQGNNALGIILAGGWYRTGLDKHKSFRNYGDLKTCFAIKIQYEDGSAENIVSDNSCKYRQSFLLNAGLFHEDQDERQEIQDFSSANFDDSEWENVITLDSPKAKYLFTDCPANKIIKYIKPTLIKEDENTKIYALPENISGFTVINGKSKVGDEITCVYGETLNDDNTVNEFHSYAQQTKFISDGRNTHNIRFTWHGFQYFFIQTTGDIKSLYCDKCAVVYADIKNTSTFKSNSKILNFIYNSYIRCQNENFQCGVPTDCPQIERKGYTGDGQLLCDLGMNLFDSKKLYKKWMQDIADSQDRKTGYVHNTAPSFIGCSGGPGGWGTAIINVPYMYYKTYGDKSVLKKYYPNMKRYLDFLDDESIDNLVEIHKRVAPCLGDWAGPKKPYLPTPFVNTCLYVETLENLIEIAEILKYEKDITEYLNKIETLKSAINNKFFDTKTGNYCDNEQGANAFALIIGLGDERTLNNLVNRYEKIKRFDTGIFATKRLIQILFEKGYQDLALKLLCSKHKISYYSWMKQGATTLWEAWENPRSLNHPMFGSPVIFFFTEILGIKQIKNAAYSDIIISPKPLEKLSHIKGSLKTVKGRIQVEIIKRNDNAHFIVVIPKAVRAEFEYKGLKIKLVSGKNIIDC